MTHRPKLLLLAASACLSALACAAPLPASASGGAFQPGYAQGGQAVTCSSDDGDRHYCNIDTSRGVQLTRQISGSPCIQNSTWGFDNRGVWVDRGCRAEFLAGGYSNQWQQDQNGQTVTCSSDNGKRNYCNATGFDLRAVTMTRQISGSPCTRNYSWGVDRSRGLWVDHGCRAEFSIGANGNQWKQGQGGQTLTCSSDDGNRHYCNADIRRGVRLTRQISGTPCIQNSTWGVDSRGVWVDRGCRAEFQIR